MSAVAEAASITVVLADFALSDAAGKINIVGGGVRIVGFSPDQGLTARVSLAVIVELPAHTLPAEFSLEVTLLSNGEVATVPGPTGPQPLRMAQTVQLERLPAEQFPVPLVRDHIGRNHQLVMDFGGGLPLSPNGVYEWQVRIDGDDAYAVRYPFAVAGPPPGLVIG